MNAFYPERLSWIRKKRGVNKTTLSKLVGVDLRSISAWEAGEFAPSTVSIEQLSEALSVLPSFFEAGPLYGPEAAQVSFRSLSKLSATKRDMALGTVATAFALSEWVSARFELPRPQIPDLREEQDPEQAAMSLRYLWGLGEKPISNMVHLLESKGVRVFSMALDIADVDACCTWKDDEPYIFLNTKKTNARRRFDAAHELGHLVLHRHGDYDASDIDQDDDIANSSLRTRSAEREADEFASAFLMPRRGFLSTAPKLANLANIVPAKSYWGVSVAAYIVRLHRLGIISEWHYRTLFQQASMKGYRKSEPFDSKKELSKIASLVLEDLRRDDMTIGDIAYQLHLNKKDVEDLIFDLAIFGLDNRSTGTHITPPRGGMRIVVDNTKK